MPLILGPILFTDFEIPEQIPFGGEQMLVVKKLVGGDRVIDAMGRDDMDLAWSGRFRGAQAEARARVVDLLRIQGQQQVLSWSTLRYRVVVKSFKADFQQSFEIPYSITCTVLEDLSSPILLAPPSVNSAVSADVNAAIGIDPGIPAVTASIAAVATNLAGIPSFQTASAVQLNGMQSSLTASLAVINGQLVPLNASLATQTGLGPQAAATALMGQSTALSQLNQLYQLRALVGRTQVNVSNAGA